jgi:hypothetical protein
MSYQTGVMTCRSNVDGHSLGEKVSTLSISDLEKINDNNTDRLDATTKGFLKAIKTTCRQWDIPKKQQKMQDVACLQCWIITGLTVYF